MLTTISRKPIGNSDGKLVKQKRYELFDILVNS